MKLQSAEAGVNDGKAGLLSSAGLFHKAGIFDKKSESFNIQNLNPYLLFDAQSSMRGTLEAPTLDLDPATPSSLDVITAVRAGVATYTDASGVIQSAIANTVRVDQTQGAELTPTVYQRVGYTDFSSGWLTSNTTISTNQAIAPDGSQTAIKLVQDNVTNKQFYTRYLMSGGDNTYTYSLYAKQADAGKHLYFELGNARAGVNLNDGSIYYGPNTFSSGWSNPSVSVVALDDGWYRVAMTVTASSSVSSFYAKNHVSVLSGSGDGIINDGDGTSGIYLWGPQVEEGTTASSFVANTTGSPKFITGATYGPRVPMILVEPSATNLLPYSEDFSHAGWSKVNNVVITSSSVDAPDGTTNAFKLSELQLTDGDYGLSEYVVTTPSTSYTFSAYLKATSDSDVGKKVRIRIRRSVGTSVASQSEVTLTDEWVRHSVTIDLFSDNTSCWFVVTKDAASPTAEQAEECLIWGAQAEAGSVATSYIPTSGSTVTRAADDLEIYGSAFSDFYNQSEGTVYFEGTSKGIESAPRLFSFSDGSTNNRIRIDIKDGINIRTAIVVSNSTVAGQTVSFTTASSLFRVALSFKVDDLECNLNGVSIVNKTPASLPPVSEMHIGSNHGGSSNYLGGRIKRLIYWPTHSDSL